MILTGPTFTTVPPRSSAGDFLGMSAVGERLYGGVFPGLNNAVRHIRPYSAICWMIHNLQKNAFSQGTADIAELRRKTQLGIWKMQLLLNWIAKIDGLQGFPGYDRFEDAPETVELRRESWPNTKISFWDTAWYKPSLLNGLRFLNEGTKDFRGTYSCTAAGIALAEAYDAAVHELEPKIAKWLADPEELICTKKRLEALRPVLDLNKPTPNERKAFLRQYFHAEFDEGKEDGKHRRQGLLLALRTLAALQGEGADRSVETIRHAMAAGFTPGGTRIDVSAIEKTQVRWSVLQVRALQRLAMETLLGLVERQVLLAEQTGKSRRTPDIADAIAEYLKPSKENSLLDTIGENYQWTREAQGGYALAQAAGLVEDNEHINLSELKRHLRGSVGTDPMDWPIAAQQAIWTLIVCAVEADNLTSMSGANRLLSWDEGKLSLGELSRIVKKFQAQTVEAFTRHIVQRFVIKQHLSVAIERSVVGLDGKDRFVFSEERDGLTRFADAAAARFLDTVESGDILFNALLLLENCGKLTCIKPEGVPAYTHRFDAAFRLKSSGNQLLSECI